MIIHKVLTSNIKYHKNFFNVSSIEGLDNRLKVVFTTLYYVALYLMVVELMIMSYRCILANVE